MGKACSKHGRDEKCIQCWTGNMEGRDHSKDVCVHGRTILERNLGK